ncbi:MAG: hypothetical protein AAF654_09355 [Myxococcota bacterium]
MAKRTPGPKTSAFDVYASEWQNVDGSIPSGGYVDAAFNADAIPNLASTSTTQTGTSIQRVDAADTNNLGDWTTTAAASSWGALNSGQ